MTQLNAHSSLRPIRGGRSRLPLLFLLLVFSAGCGDCGGDGGKKQNNNNMKVDMSSDMGDMTSPTDMGDMSVPTDMGDMAPTDMGDMPPPTDMGDMPPPTDMGDMGDMPPTDMGDMDIPDQPDMVEDVRTCPENLRSSCIYQTLSCFGGSEEFDQCFHDPLLSFDETLFKSGARGQYRSFEMGGMITREFRAVSPDGAQCYRALAQQTGMTPSVWRVQDFDTQFAFDVQFNPTTVQVTCPNGDVEVCSRSRFELFFAWPDEAPMACPDRDPMNDQCNFDTDCPGDNQCCRPGENQPRQCFAASFCMAGRTPEYCETTADCGVNEECKRCNRGGAAVARECVPANFNDLGCLDDTCSPGDGTCTDPRVCCVQGGVAKCSVPNECDSPPDPNPTCNSTDAQPCANSNQQCCFVSQLDEFRCIDNTAPCRTNVCFADTDCPSGQSCCNADAATNKPGTCLEQCGTPVPGCTVDTDCDAFFGTGAVCCKYPGYTSGFCGPDVGACIYRSCQADPNSCLSGQTCCNAAPLTEAICIDSGQTCPPAAP